MTFCPTTKWRPSKGFKASTSTELHGMWRNSALSGLLFRTVPLSATLLAGRAVFVVFLLADFFPAFVFSFFFFIRESQGTILHPFIQPAVDEDGLAGDVGSALAGEPDN